MIKVLGFAPDADKTTIGIIPDCGNLVPTNKGMEAVRSLSAVSGVSALAGDCLGAAVVTKLDGTRRIFAGTDDAIYELLSGVWTDVSDVSGYSGGSETVWSIAQFGDATLMSNGADAIQRSTTGDFAAISGAPIAEIVFSVGAHVMAMNVNDGTEKTNGWHCCAIYDDTDWTESVTTQSASGRLVSTPGAIVAGARLGDYAIAYKERSIYVGSYVGGDDVWQWQLVSGGDAGCVGKRAICDIDGTHFFVGPDNFWLFNGVTATPIADGVLRDWFSDNCSSAYRYKSICTYDKTTGRAWVFYPSTNSATIDSAVIYHVQSKKWGRATVSIQAAMEYVSAGMTIDDLDDIAATIDALPDIPFDSPYWNAGDRAMTVFDSSSQLSTFSGEAGNSWFETFEVGDDYAFSFLSEVRIRFITPPDSASIIAYSKDNSGDSFSSGDSVDMVGQKFDVLQSARWHKGIISMIGMHEFSGISAKTIPDGYE